VRTNHHPSQLRAYLAMSWYVLLAMMRNISTVVFGFAFPLAFIAVFGLVGSQDQKVRLGIPDTTSQQSPIVMAVKNISAINVTSDTSGNLDALLKQGKLDGELLVSGSGKSEQATLVTSSGNPAGAATATSILRGVVDQLNLNLSGVTNPPITLQTSEISGRKSRYIDFALPGMIGFSLLSTSLFGTVFGFIFLKKQLVLKRMFATPVKALTILLAQGSSRLVMAFVQTAVIIGIGVLAFNFYLPHGLETLGELAILSFLGLVTFMGFGLFISGFAKDENGAGPLTNLVSLPQFLLSGVFFSTDSFPSWVKPIADNLPLSYFNSAVRKVTTEGGTIIDAWPYLVGLMAWAVVVYLLASRTFKWE
jgi:ABC-2 type transport system permease protein